MPTLVDEIEVRLMDLLRPGEPLPKEVELAESFGVSRPVVREALTRLRAVGLVESVRHKGSVVTHADVLSPFERVLQPHVLHADTLRDIFELRLVLEIGMADLLFARVTAADLEALDEIVADEPQGTVVFDPAFEVRFHGKLYEITGNTTLRRFQDLLLPVFTHVHASGLLERLVKPGRGFVTHRGLVKLIRTGTPESFREGMRRHLDRQFQRVL